MSTYVIEIDTDLDLLDPESELRKLIANWKLANVDIGICIYQLDLSSTIVSVGDIIEI